MNNNQNSEQQLNVIPQMNTANNNQPNDAHQFDNAFINNIPTNNTNNQNTFFNNPMPNNNTQLDIGGMDEEMKGIVKAPQNRFINDNVETSSNTLNDLNVEGGGDETPKVDYSKDPKVMENLNKKNTITIGSEGKIFIIIIIVLLVFIFGLPTIFDLIRKVQYQ